MTDMLYRQIEDSNERLHIFINRVLAVIVFAVLICYQKVVEGQTPNAYGDLPPEATAACVGYGCYMSRFFATGLGMVIGLAALALFVYGIFHVLVLSKRERTI